MRPRAKARAGLAHGLGQQTRRGLAHNTNLRPVDRRNNLALLSLAPRARDNWRRLPHRCGFRDRIGEGGHGAAIAKFDSVSGLAQGHVNIRGQRQARRPGAVLVAYDGLRPDDKLGTRHTRIAEARDERGVGAIFKKTAHEIGEQVFMSADRRVDPARKLRDLGPQGSEKVFAHAVEALEFKALDISSQFDDCRYGKRVMGRELRIDDVSHAEELFGARKITEIGHRLA